MSRAKPTPGPFHVNPEWPVVVMTPDNRRVAYCYAAHSDFTEEMAQAHARLIASAPELLAAAKAKLKDCRENGDCADAALMPGECCSEECAALATAIEKAEGPNTPEAK